MMMTIRRSSEQVEKSLTNSGPLSDIGNWGDLATFQGSLPKKVDSTGHGVRGKRSIVQEERKKLKHNIKTLYHQDWLTGSISMLLCKYRCLTVYKF